MDIWKLIKLFLSGKIIGGRGDGSLDLIYSFCIKSRHKFGLRTKFENIWLGTLCDLYFVLNFSPAVYCSYQHIVGKYNLTFEHN